NLTDVHLVTADQLNTYDVLVSDDIVFTEAALNALLEGPVRGKSAKAVASSAELTGASNEAGVEATTDTGTDTATNSDEEASA
ncbi:MAG: hypothetical protein ACJ73J_08930, partial [Actinomycetes bacterium]